MFALQEDTKLGVTLNDRTGLPSTIFTKTYKEDVRGMFIIVLMDAFKGPELAKRKALIFSMSVDYVFFMEIKGVYSIMITSMIF